MKFNISGLSFLLIPILVNGILSMLRAPKKGEKGKVYLPKAFVILGTAGLAPCLIVAVVTFFTEGKIWLPIILLVFSLVGASLIVAYLNCRVEYNEHGFTAKNFFGIKRKYTYDQVTSIRNNMHEDYLYVGKRRVMIDEFAIGGHEFIGFVRKQYRKINDGHALPVLTKSKWDLFDGHVSDAGGFLFVYIMLGVLFLGFGVFLTVVIWFMPYTADNTIEQQVAFVSGKADDGDYVMTSLEGNIYKVEYWNERSDQNAIREISDDCSPVTVYIEEADPDDEEKYDLIYAVKKDDTYLLTFDETNRLQSKADSVMILFPVGFLAMWALFIIFSVKVGRNPQKYGRKIVRLFFKDGYVKY